MKGSLPGAWFYISTNGVPVNGRSILCIVTTLCLSADSALGVLLGSVALDHLKLSFAVFPVTLKDGVTTVPAGFYLSFEFDMFEIFHVAADVTFDLVSFKLDAVAAIPGLSIQAAAYVSVFDPMGMYFYVSVVLNPLAGAMAIPQLLCRFANLCMMHSSMQDQNVLGKAFDITLVVSFALREQSLTLLGGVVHLPRGFKFSFATTIASWSATIEIVVDAYPGGFSAAVTGKLGAINTGVFKLCASASNCNEGPYVNAAFSASTTGATISVRAECYVYIFGITVSSQVRISNTEQQIDFYMDVWDFHMKAVYRSITSSAPGAVAIGGWMHLEMNDLTLFFTGLINAVMELLDEAAKLASAELAKAKNAVNDLIAKCKSDAHDAAVSFCSHCFDVCYSLASVACELCTKCNPIECSPIVCTPITCNPLKCTWKGCSGGSCSGGSCSGGSCTGGDCYSCASTCKADAVPVCTSGCVPCVSVALAIPYAACDLLKIANVALDAADLAVKGISAAVDLVGKILIEALEHSPFKITAVVLDETFAASVLQGSLSMSANVDAAISYTLFNKAGTLNLHVAFATKGDVFKQLGKWLIDQLKK